MPRARGVYDHVQMIRERGFFERARKLFLNPQKFIENLTNNQSINLPPIDKNEELESEDPDEL